MTPDPRPLTSLSSELITDSQIAAGRLRADLKEQVTFTLLRRHRHQTKKSNLRSLADIGKSVSSASRLFSGPENGTPPPRVLHHSSPSSSKLNNNAFLFPNYFPPFCLFSASPSFPWGGGVL